MCVPAANWTGPPSNGLDVGSNPTGDDRPVVQGAAEVSKTTALGSIPSTGDYVQ